MSCKLRLAFCSLATVTLSSVLLAQAPTQPCPLNAPVDEVIAEINKQKPPRNKQLLPENICIWGWCRQPGKLPTPKPKPGTEQSATPTSDPDSATQSADGYSTSKTESDKCLEAMESTIDAARDVDTGDFYANSKNYKGALMRYQSALEKKPGDAAIYVRLGRAYERLKDIPHARENYTAASNLPGPEKWVNEAKDALVRIGK